jgi:hypothetical protein
LLFAPVTSVARQALGMGENVGTLHQRPSTAPRPVGLGEPAPDVHLWHATP